MIEITYEFLKPIIREAIDTQYLGSKPPNAYFVKARPIAKAIIEAIKEKK